MTLFQEPKVEYQFLEFKKSIREKLLTIREIIFEVADENKEIGKLTETLRWGQPSYIPLETNSGTLIRLDKYPIDDHYGVYFHCQTNLVDSFRQMFPKLKYQGNRAIFFSIDEEIPKDILEAARIDGASLGQEIVFVLLPIALPGIASTLLLNVILAWNEAFWTLILTAANAAPLTAFIASYSSPEGLFYAKLSAASAMAIAPILVMGWFSQKQLVRGLSFGAVK